MTQTMFAPHSPIVLCSETGLTLRTAGPNDYQFAYSVKKTAFREYVEKIEGWDEDEQRRLHDERFAAQDFWMISLAGTDVGVLALVVTPEFVKVNQLFLLPKYQRQGIGRIVMHFVMEEASRLSLPVRLRVLKSNPRASVFYERLGFVPTGETDSHDLMEWRV